MERIEAPAHGTRHTWDLRAADLGSETVLETTALAIGYREPILKVGPLRVARDARVAIVGPNGAGKTTLVRTLLGELAPLEGYVSSAPMVRVAYLEQAQAELTGSESVLESLRAASGLAGQEARDLLARFLFRGDEVDRAVGVLSGGERARLALARLATRDANLLVLDEPTNHLDLAAREQLESVLEGFGGTLIFVSHDRYFVDKLASELWLIDRGELRRFEGSWTRYQRERAAGREAQVIAFEAGRDVERSGARAGDTRREGASDGERRGTRVPDPSVSANGEDAGGPRVSARSLGGPLPERGRTREGAASKRRSSAVRHISGLRALESRIEAMELQLRQLTEKVAQIAQSGNYMETRRIGEEHAALERSLRELYDEWAKQGGAETDPE